MVGQECGWISFSHSVGCEGIHSLLFRHGSWVEKAWNQSDQHVERALHATTARIRCLRDVMTGSVGLDLWFGS